MHHIRRISSIKHQSPHLNALPRILILLRGIRKRRVRHPPGNSLLLFGVEALDQRHLVRPLRILEVPSMSGVWLDGEGLACAVGVDEGRADEVRFRDRVGVCYG